MTLRPQGEMENADDALLNFGFEIDQHVAATDQVDPGERRVAKDVLDAEDDRFAQFLADLKGLMVGILDKIALQARWR